MGTDLLPFDEAAALVATVSFLGVLLLAPLYLSQRRDIQRLREWMLKHPEHPAADLARSESRLDRTEVELERIYAGRGQPVPVEPEEEREPGLTPIPPGAPASRVTTERPALERITMERAALEPHQRLRRWRAVALQPRWLATLAVSALLVAVGGVVVVQEGLLGDDEGAADGPEVTGIEVAVLNTTSAGGIGGRVARQIEDAGYVPGAVQSFVRDADQTVVMYEPGQQRAARRVARELGGAAVQKIDREVQTQVPTADVVVVLGQDRIQG